MKTKIDWALGADVRVRGATHIGGEWTLETVRVGPSRCPGCGRTVDERPQHLPMQAGRVILNARASVELLRARLIPIEGLSVH